ncbi:ABC transporter ATP-binding protein [Paenibacillus chitinolyticus]|nr:ABC transporter ATP-binding protein [Paenibacillus chitinolyticus]MEC0244337.1 ABC transporter ATP-binding protein [Paenibacillus chitinolyticus]
MNVGTKLFKYVLYYKKSFIGALCLLLLMVAAELSGPIIAKRLIDQHILGIEKPWYETREPGENAVPYKGKHYKRGDYFHEQEEKGQEVRILQVQRQFVFVPEAVKADGERIVQGDRLIIKRNAETGTYPADILSTRDLFLFYEPELEKIVNLILLYFGFVGAASLLEYGQTYALQVSSNRVIQKMRIDVLKQIHRIPISYFDRIPAGRIVSCVTNDTEAVKELFVTVLRNFFTGTVYITGILTALFILDVRLALICTLIIPALAGWICLYQKFASKYSQTIRSTLSDINGLINETIQCMPVIRAFSRQRTVRQEFEDKNVRYFTYSNKLLTLKALTSNNLVTVLRSLALAAIIWYFGSAGLSHQSVFTFGMIYAFVEYVERLFQPLVGMVNQLAQLNHSLVSAERVFRLMEEEGSDVADEETPRMKGNVKFENVSFAYSDDHYVLRDISFEAKQGQTIAFVGHTGSGKSSIMNVLLRFYELQKGTVTIDGYNIQTLSRQQVRKQIGIVLQEPFLFTGTIASNISLDNPAISRELIEESLRAVGARRVLQHLPNGLDEPVIEKGSTLSVGQKQLISFARALAYNTPVLILDEATSNIDTETEGMIQSALEVLKKGRTTLVIAHRLSTIHHADLILVMDRGRIAERGNHDELMRYRGIYYQMYQLQMRDRANVPV